ncbi:hypothetical protein V1264_016744 [Littorina saxatilis]|uniref:Uncharacterized protein n=1 Tax=Littorina saxatilis TaxID=31220 RepID=A0AAN9BHN3_9CAEN
MALRSVSFCEFDSYLTKCCIFALRDLFLLASELTAYNVALRKEATYISISSGQLHRYTETLPDLTYIVKGRCAILEPRHHGRGVVNFFLITLATQPSVNYRVYGVSITKDNRARDPDYIIYTIYVGGNGLNKTIPTEATLCASNQRFSQTRLVRCERLTVGSYVRIDVAGLSRAPFVFCNVQVYGRLYGN